MNRSNTHNREKVLCSWVLKVVFLLLNFVVVFLSECVSYTYSSNMSSKAPYFYKSKRLNVCYTLIFNRWGRGFSEGQVVVKSTGLMGCVVWSLYSCF